MGEHLDSADRPDKAYERTPFGKEMLKHFQFAKGWTNLNQGSFGASPYAIRDKQRQIQAECEAQPDLFIRYTYPKLLDESREALAGLLNVPASSVVVVPNATTGVNTILRNLVWDSAGKDEILYFDTVYGACGKTAEYISEVFHGAVVPRVISIEYPLEDADLCNIFKKAVQSSRAEGKNPRIAVFDTISSAPGLRVPFESLVSICKEEGILSLVDGAHGIGQIPLDLSKLDPDFFVSNAHKWLHVPRGCAVLYVPERNQALIRSTLPTSHGFVAKSPGLAQKNPWPKSAHGEFVANFMYVGTFDNTNYLCVAEAIKWREQVCGGEAAIMDYNINLAREGGKTVAKILGTHVLDNNAATLTNCAVANVMLPLTLKAGEEARKADVWLLSTMMKEYKTYVPILFLYGKWWVRFSSQIYLERSDFEWAGNMLKDLCQRVTAGDHLTTDDSKN